MKKIQFYKGVINISKKKALFEIFLKKIKIIFKKIKTF